eukprot:TRINITY_DN17134_c0_g1_i1.p1 TRINITY_DN17134_c0_g1~~TRINITY_DN17134_c0_g1_i1.p1  ORF type:complete len:406 (+),score=137.60 TRINITY_DN17134_c0_g1_i1:76-1293(+)
MRVTAALLLAQAAAGFGAIDEIEQPRQFTSDVLRADGEAVVVVLYDPASLTEERRAPLEAAAAELSGLARVVSVDVSRPGLRWIADAYHVRFLPEIMLFTPDAKPAPQGKEGVDTVTRPGGIRTPRFFEGSVRTAQAIKSWAVGKLPDADVPKVTAASAAAVEKAVAAAGGKSMLVLFTDKDKTSPLFKALALALRGRIEMAVIKVKDLKPLSDVVTSVPLLRVYTGDGGKLDYGGKMDVGSILSFVEPHTRVSRAERREAAARADDAEFSILQRRALSPVLKLESKEEWAKEVLDRPHLTLVAFLDSSSSSHDSYMKALGTVAKADRGLVRSVVWAEAANQGGLMGYFGVEAGGAVFVSPKFQRWTLFRGAMSESGLTTFIKTTLARGAGGRALDTAALPEFGA